MSKKVVNEKVLKNLIETITENLDYYDFYNNFIFNAEELVDTIFKHYISTVEGGPCCADKSGFIVSRIKQSLKERKNIPIRETYREYKAKGGNLGGINESNTNLDNVCYWCPKTIKDTDSAISLFFELIDIGKIAGKIKKNSEQITKIERQIKVIDKALDLACGKTQKKYFIKQAEKEVE